MRSRRWVLGGAGWIAAKDGRYLLWPVTAGWVVGVGFGERRLDGLKSGMVASVMRCCERKSSVGLRATLLTPALSSQGEGDRVTVSESTMSSRPPSGTHKSWRREVDFTKACPLQGEDGSALPWLFLTVLLRNTLLRSRRSRRSNELAVRFSGVVSLGACRTGICFKSARRLRGWCSCLGGAGCSYHGRSSLLRSRLGGFYRGRSGWWVKQRCRWWFPRGRLRSRIEWDGFGQFKGCPYWVGCRRGRCFARTDDAGWTACDLAGDV